MFNSHEIAEVPFPIRHGPDAPGVVLPAK